MQELRYLYFWSEIVDITTIIKDFWYSRNLQEFVNRRFKSSEKSVITHKNYDHIVLKNGAKFYVTEDFRTVEEVMEDYKFSGITPDMTVLDIGANIGGFTIQAARIAKRVVAYEPVMYLELERNVQLNALDNVTVFHEGVGAGNLIDIMWDDESHTIKTKLFKEIIQDLTSPIAAKIDCEGFEKYINPEDLQRFDRIEMELHWDKNVAENIIKTLQDTHTIFVDHRGAFGIYGILHATRK